MIKQVFLLVLLGLMLPVSSMAQTEILVDVAWDQVWEYEDGTAAQRENLAHWEIYICDSPIVAGGQEADDVQLEAPVCVGELKVIRATGETADASYAAPHQSGNLYLRLSAVAVHGTKSRLSEEFILPYKFQRFKPPGNVRVTIRLNTE